MALHLNERFSPMSCKWNGPFSIGLIFTLRDYLYVWNVCIFWDSSSFSFSFTHTYTHKLTHWCVKSGWRWNSTYVLSKVRKEVHVSYFCLLYWTCYYHIGPGCCFDSGLLVGKIVPAFLHKFWHFIYLSLLSSDDSVVWTGRVWACLSFSIVSSNKGGKLAWIAK